MILFAPNMDCTVVYLLILEDKVGVSIYILLLLYLTPYSDILYATLKCVLADGQNRTIKYEILVSWKP